MALVVVMSVPVAVVVAGVRLCDFFFRSPFEIGGTCACVVVVKVAVTGPSGFVL